jgi:hypothetical protein
MSGEVDVRRLQELLRLSKQTSARGQQLLDDPEGANLVGDYQDVLERALRSGRYEVAEKAAATLANLQHLEDEVVRTARQSQDAEADAVRLLLDLRSRNDD